MKVGVVILLCLTLFSCENVGKNGKPRSANDRVEQLDELEELDAVNQYDWEDLLLKTPYVSDLNELSEFQKSQLNLIKYNFPKIESIAFDQARIISNEYYQDTFDTNELELSGIHMFNDTTEVIEFYFKLKEESKSLTSIVLFKKFRFLGTTFID